MVVATGDVEILQVVKEHSIPVVMTRFDHQSGTDRVAEAAAKLGADLVINLQGDEPFVAVRDLETMIQALGEGRGDLVTLSAPIATHEELFDPNVVKVVTRDDGRALYFSRAPIPYGREDPRDPSLARRHIGIYGYTREALDKMTEAPPHPLEDREGLEQLRALAMGLSIVVLPAETRGRGIDTPEDLSWARAQVAELGEAAFPT